jgi:hypothetical protein
VRRSLTQRGTLQAIGAGKHLRRYSQWVFDNQPSGDNLEALYASLDFEALRKRLEEWSPQESFKILGPDETEDVVGLYLQDSGWRMVKSSTYRNQRAVECEFVRAGESHVETGYMQVKSGNIPLRVAHYLPYAKAGSYVYLFSTAQDPYPDSRQHQHPRVIPLTISQIASFIASGLQTLPVPLVIKLSVWAGIL